MASLLRWNQHTQYLDTKSAATNIARRVYSYAASKIWNSLPYTRDDISFMDICKTPQTRPLHGGLNRVILRLPHTYKSTPRASTHGALYIHVLAFLANLVV